jgi:hypothetical protein
LIKFALVERGFPRRVQLLLYGFLQYLLETLVHSAHFVNKSAQIVEKLLVSGEVLEIEAINPMLEHIDHFESDGLLVLASVALEQFAFGYFASVKVVL